MSLMVYRKRRNRYSMSSSGGAEFNSGNLKDEEMDDVRRAATGHGWFMVGGGARRNDNDDDNYGLDQQGYGSNYRGGHTNSKRDMDTQLFEGFDSSVMLEDHHHNHEEQLVRPEDMTGRNHLQQGRHNHRESIDTSSSSTARAGDDSSSTTKYLSETVIYTRLKDRLEVGASSSQNTSPTSSPFILALIPEFSRKHPHQAHHANIAHFSRLDNVNNSVDDVRIWPSNAIAANAVTRRRSRLSCPKKGK
ncbi:hypothetical protein BGZ58_007885 [Dissophora ornata]|nr:hypothetical protein BGZ58_007878 [Dissophora ornata]KAF8940068.1 hypothetical protein BGZ58_007885 [Dissophora ornata]